MEVELVRQLEILKSADQFTGHQPLGTTLFLIDRSMSKPAEPATPDSMSEGMTTWFVSVLAWSCMFDARCIEEQINDLRPVEVSIKDCNYKVGPPKP